MTKKQIKEASSKMGVNNEWATEARIRHLLHLIEKEVVYQGSLNKSLSLAKKDITTYFLKQVISTSKKNEESYRRELKRLKAAPSNNPELITDDDIETARNYPIDKVIEFKHGRCKGFCHDGDSELSMSHFVKGNKVKCFVCDRSFSALDVLIERDNYSFIDAVKELRG